jgi:hypothetical protein
MSSLDFHVENQQGQSAVVDDDHVLAQLKGMGYPVAGVSADGMHITFQDPQQGQYQVKTSDTLKEMGWNVKGTLPSNPDYENIQHDYRLGLESLPADEDMRKAYLEAKLKRSGIEDPQLVGNGSDWHVFNPQTSQWIALTNKPGIDVSDLAEVGAAAPHFLGSALGGTAGGVLGAAAGPLGSVAGAAGGAGLGGGMGDALGRYLLSRADPEYRQVASQHFGEVAGDVAKTAALDAATFGGLKALGIASPALRTLIAKGPISTGLKGLGSAAEGAGFLTGRPAGMLARAPAASEVASNFVPGLGDAINLGYLARVPGGATRSLPKALNWLGSNEVTAPLFGDQGAAGLRGMAEELSRARPGSAINQGVEDVSRAFGATGPSSNVQQSRNVMGNIFEKGARGLGYPEAAGGAGRAGEILGRAAGHLEDVGQGVSRMGSGLFRAGLRGVQGAGRGLEGGGGLLRNAATIAQPLEVPALTRYGLGQGSEEMQRRLRRDPLTDILEDKTVLASQNY